MKNSIQKTKTIGQTELEVIVADITKLAVDAVVNAANNSLLGGGGVDGAIHRAAGPDLLKECRQIGGCPTGEAKLTKGYLLPARFVIHTVGPVWHGGHNDESVNLSGAYRNSLILASKNELRSIAFPAISTGVYGYPQDIAAVIAIGEAEKFASNEQYVFDRIIFCCFSDESAKYHMKALDEFSTSAKPHSN